MWNIHSVVFVACATATLANADLACIPSKPIASSGDIVRLFLYASKDWEGSRYSWSVTAGTLKDDGRTGKVQKKKRIEVGWMFSDVKAGMRYTATVTVTNAAKSTQDCSLEVEADVTAGSRGVRETGRVLLARGQNEEPDFGLYSYLLFGSEPDNNTRQRYLNAANAYLRLCPDIADLKILLDRKQLNANYLPVKTQPGGDTLVNGEWLLNNYDYARARAILSKLPGSHFRGPYIVTTLKRVDPTVGASPPMIYQDLSFVPPDLIVPWYEAFLNQAAQERFSETNTAQNLTLKIRTIIGVLALALPDVQAGVKYWEHW